MGRRLGLRHRRKVGSMKEAIARLCLKFCKGYLDISI